jgi:hypothetical protein
MPTLASISKRPSHPHQAKQSTELTIDYMDQKGCFMVHPTLQVQRLMKRVRF